jgi:hypothetical protein
MSEQPKIVFNVGSPPKKKPKLRTRIRKHITDYLVMKLNEQLVLGLVHSGFEPIAGKKEIFMRQSGQTSEWRLKINKAKISIINWILLFIGG